MVIKPKISYISKILNTRVTIQALTSMSTKIHKKHQYVHKKPIVAAALPTAAQGRNRRRYRHDHVSVRQRRPHSSVGRDPHQARHRPKPPPPRRKNGLHVALHIVGLLGLLIVLHIAGLLGLLLALLIGLHIVLL